jgi:15-cis-phytoene synthase
VQVTNIARDVGEDARAGRLYLPLTWLREAGIDPETFLSKPVYSVALANIVHRLLRVADLHYAVSESAITRLPATCRPGIMAARMLYAGIGREVERAGCNSVDRRAVVGPLRKAALIAKAMTVLASPATATATAALPEADFLIDAVAAAPGMPERFDDDRTPWWDLDRRLVWLIDLFERLERQEQTQRY